MAFAYILQPSLLTRLDGKIYDLLLPLRAAPAPSPVPVIIDLDEASLAVYGQWPWPRYLLADLLDALTGYGVAAIGLDIMFAESDRSSPEQMRESLRRHRGFTPAFADIPDELRDYDRIMAGALRRSPAVIGGYADYGNREGTEMPPASVTLIERELPGAVPWLPFLPKADSALLPLPELRESAPLGFINAAPDTDGIIRRIPLLIRIGDRVWPTLALRTLMRGLGQRNLTLVSGPYGLEALRIKVGKESLSVPASPGGDLHIPFIGPRRTYPYHSAADVLQGRVAAQALQGRVVFVGTSVAGLSDMRATPHDPACPGVEVHAAAVDAMLNGNALLLPPWLPLAQLAGITLTGAISTAVFGFARPRVHPPAIAALLGLIVMGSRHLFAGGIYISPLYCTLTAIGCAAFLALARFWREERQKRKLRGIFSRYVAPDVVERITGSGEDLFAGEEKTLSILFSDIRGFTSLAETLRPREVVSLLNRYFSGMTAVVRGSGGTLDKFIGDALMAYWNAPLDVPDHALRAVTAALDMQAALPALNRELKRELDIAVHIGVGVHTGAAFVGNMGSNDLVSYTLIGDNVNLASRLEGLCPQYGAGVIVSGEARQACGEAFAFQHLDTLRVKGKQQAVSIFQPLRHEEALERRGELAAWEDARLRYAEGDFAGAEKRLAALCGDFPENRLYAVFAERLERLVREPPRFWNGIWILSSK
jgi:adenylate cyclase